MKFAPPAEFAKAARVGSLEAWRTALRTERPGSRGILGRPGARSSSAGGGRSRGARLELHRAEDPLVRGRHAQRLRELPRPPRRGGPRRPDRDHLGRRRSRADAAASPTASCSGTSTRFAARPPAERRRSAATASASTCPWCPRPRSRCSPARASARSTRSCSAGSRPRACATGSTTPTCRLLITADQGMRGGKRRRAQEDRGRRRSRPRPSIERVIVLRRTGAAGRDSTRPRPLVARGDRGGRPGRRRRARRDGRRGPALHPLHLGIDREAEGRAAHDGRLPRPTPRSRT